MLFWRSRNLDTEKKIEKSRYPKEDISIPTKRVTRLKLRAQNCEKWLVKSFEAAEKGLNILGVVSGRFLQTSRLTFRFTFCFGTKCFSGQVRSAEVPP